MFFLFLFNYVYMCISVNGYMHMWVQIPWRSEYRVRPPGAGSSAIQHGWWELKLGPLKEPYVLIRAERSPALWRCFLLRPFQKSFYSFISLPWKHCGSIIFYSDQGISWHFKLGCEMLYFLPQCFYSGKVSFSHYNFTECNYGSLFHPRPIFYIWNVMLHSK